MQINLNGNEITILGAACICITIVIMGLFITVYICSFMKKNIIGITYDEKIRRLQTKVDTKISELEEEIGYSFSDFKNDITNSIKEDTESINLKKSEENIFEEIINEYLT